MCENIFPNGEYGIVTLWFSDIRSDVVIVPGFVYGQDGFELSCVIVSFGFIGEELIGASPVNHFFRGFSTADADIA